MPTQSSSRAYPPDLATAVTQSLPDGGWANAELSIPSFGVKPFEIQRGEQLGCFEIVRPLGRGGMGEVYLATDRRLARRVALKLLACRFQGNEARSRLQQEARAASSLNHPNILTVYEVGECAGRAFIATEFIDGITLREHLRRKRLSTSAILDIAIQAASALEAAHSAGIVHLDISPRTSWCVPTAM